jgi:hypothetical protein
MRELKITFEQAVKDYPDLVGKFLKEINQSRSDVVLEEIYFFYYWTLTNKESPMEEYKHMLTFEERLDYELSKLNAEIYMKFDTYIRGEIVDHLDFPVTIIDDVKQVLIPVMRYEQGFYKNDMVINSIPDIEIDESIIKFLPESKIKLLEEPKELNTLDDLLDKIYDYGYDNLTEKEKEILKKISENR